MGTGYTRNDTLNNIADGNIINASDLDGEFDAVESAFNESTGHTHDGTAAEGAPITVLGPVQDFIASATEIKPKTTNTLDIGTVSLQFKDMYLDGTAYIDGLGEDILVATDKKIQFRDTALFINSSVDGQLDIDADVELQLVAPTVDIDASTALTVDTASTTFTSTLFNVTGSANITGDLDVDNININGNTISSTDTNGNITLAPDGTGVVALSSTDLTFGDNDKAVFGAGSDLEISHNGTENVIDSNAGTLVLRSAGAGTIELRDQGSQVLAQFNDNADAKLFYNNNLKIATTSTGVDVTGTVTADGLTVDGTAIINSSSNTPLLRFDESGSAKFFIGESSAVGGGAGYDLYAGTGDGISLFTNASEAMRIDSSGNVGIGTTTNNQSSSTASVTLNAASGMSAYELRNADVFSGYVGHNGTNMYLVNAKNGSLGLYTNNTERMRIDSSGNVGIGTSSTNYGKFTVQNTAGTGKVILDTYQAVPTTENVMAIYADASNGYIDSYNNGYKNIIIAGSGGSVGIGGSPSQKLHVVGQAIISRGTGSAEGLSVGTTSTNTGTNLGCIDINGQSYSALYLRTANTSRSYIFQTASYTSINTFTAIPLTFGTSDTERMRIDGSGKVGIGTSSMVRSLEITDGTSGKIRVKGTDGGFIECHNGTNGVYFGTAPAVLGSGSGGDSVIFTDSGFNQLYYTSGVERMRISSGGNVFFGCTDFPSASVAGFTINGTSSGNASSSGASTAAYNHLLFYNGNGLVGYISTSGSTTSFANISDYRLKTAVNYDWDATTRLKQLRPARFEWIADGDDAVPVDGFLAHEVQDVVPEAITGTKDAMMDEEYEVTPAVLDEDGNVVTPAVMGTRSVPDYQGIDQSKLVPLLVKTIQELEARIAALEAN